MVKFLYELLSLSKGDLLVKEVPLTKREDGYSKLDVASLGFSSFNYSQPNFKIIAKKAFLDW